MIFRSYVLKRCVWLLRNFIHLLSVTLLYHCRHLIPLSILIVLTRLMYVLYRVLTRYIAKSINSNYPIKIFTLLYCALCTLYLFVNKIGICILTNHELYTTLIVSNVNMFCCVLLIDGTRGLNEKSREYAWAWNVLTSPAISLSKSVLFR